METTGEVASFHPNFNLQSEKVAQRRPVGRHPAGMLIAPPSPATPRRRPEAGAGHSKPMREEMTYRVSYDEVRTHKADQPLAQDIARIEYFYTEQEALSRARELLETADHHAIALADGTGNVVGGIRLQLRLGYTAGE
jgi:hypothetical protein